MLGDFLAADNVAGLHFLTDSSLITLGESEAAIGRDAVPGVARRFVPNDSLASHIGVSQFPLRLRMAVLCGLLPPIDALHGIFSHALGMIVNISHHELCPYISLLGLDAQAVVIFRQYLGSGLDFSKDSSLVLKARKVGNFVQALRQFA